MNTKMHSLESGRVMKTILLHPEEPIIYRLYTRNGVQMALRQQAIPPAVGDQLQMEGALFKITEVGQPVNSNEVHLTAEKVSA